jgi:hypothetical protein
MIRGSFYRRFMFEADGNTNVAFRLSLRIPSPLAVVNSPLQPSVSEIRTVFGVTVLGKFTSTEADMPDTNPVPGGFRLNTTGEVEFIKQSLPYGWFLTSGARSRRFRFCER